jgi:hypothetical protein
MEDIDIVHNVLGADSRSMSIDSGYSECRDRTSSAQSYCSAESDSSIVESKNDEEDEYNRSSQQLSICIPIRTREMTMSDILSKTPTPSKYYFMLQENENLIKSMNIKN